MGPEGSKSHVTTRVMGTFGYAAPEYVSTGSALGLFGLSFLLDVFNITKLLLNMKYFFL